MQGGSQELLTAGAALVADVLERFGAVTFRASGSSMCPTIRPGDVLDVVRCSHTEVRRGDVVLLRQGSRLIAHRLMAADAPGGLPGVVTRGDSRWRADPPAPGMNLLGRIVALTRAGRRLDAPFGLSPLTRVRGIAEVESHRFILRARATIRRWLIS